MMFTVKLASSETFNVTAAEQSYSAADYTGRKKFRLRLECSPASHDLEWYLEKLSQEGALESVQVFSESGAKCFQVEGYTELDNSALRLLSTGERELTLSLAKPLPPLAQILPDEEKPGI